MTTKTIFVVGATGRVGLAGHRRPAGRCEHSSRDPASARQRSDRLGSLCLEDASTHTAALAGVDAVFLMRPPQISKGSAFVPFLEAAKALNIKRVVVLSVAGAESNAILPHHAVEKVVMEMGFDWTMVRPADFMQNLETVHLEGIRDRDEIAVPAGQGRSSFIDVADIGEVIATSLLQEGHSRKGYTLTGPEALNFDDVARILTDILGRPIRYRRLGALSFLWEQIQRRQPMGISLVMTAL